MRLRMWGLATICLVTVILISTLLAGAEENVTLRIGNWWVADDQEVWQIGLDAFKKKYPNVNFQSESAPYVDHHRRLQAQFAAGTLPDIIMISVNYGPPYAAAGMFMNLNKWIEKDPSVDVDDFYYTYKYKDQIWGFPYDTSTWALVYNKEMFDKQGLAYPTEEWTWSDYLENAKKLTLDTDGDGKVDQWGSIAPGLDPYKFESMVRSEGGQYFADDYSECLVNDPRVKKVFQYWHDLTWKYHVTPTPDVAQGLDLFTTGKVAMAIEGQWVIRPYSQRAEFPWDVAYLPKGSAGRKLITGGSGYAIASTTKQPELAWEFLKHYTSSDMLSKMVGLTGRGIPARRSSAWSFTSGNPVPEHRDVWIKQLAYTELMQIPFAYLKWYDEFQRALEPVMLLNQGTVSDALDKLKQKMDVILSKTQR